MTQKVEWVVKFSVTGLIPQLPPLHDIVSLSKMPNTKLLLMSRLAPCTFWQKSSLSVHRCGKVSKDSRKIYLVVKVIVCVDYFGKGLNVIDIHLNVKVWQPH